MPLSHALAGPVDRIYVMQRVGDLMRPAVRSPLDVAVRAFAISRNQRFDLELRHDARDVEVVVLPRPSDDRDLFDFSAREAHRRGPRPRQPALDEHEAARPAPRRPPPWLRRDAETLTVHASNDVAERAVERSVAQQQHEQRGVSREVEERAGEDADREGERGGDGEHGRRRVDPQRRRAGLGASPARRSPDEHRHHDPQVEERGDDGGERRPTMTR